MTEFASWRQYWEFSSYVMRTSRYIFDARNEAFIRAVIDSSASREAAIAMDSGLWRAQLADEVRFDEEEELVGIPG